MNSHVAYGPYEKVIKRILDLLISIVVVLLFSWLYLLLTVIGFFFMGGNPFFTQKRIGKNNKEFQLIKFRSMSNKTDSKGNLLPDDIRLNKYGRFLRTTSMDELPEIFNIIKGDMSLVGPRPLVSQYLPYYTEKELHRHDVRPGLSGWAQVNGRTIIDWETRFEYDLEYVNKITFLKDLQIILMTIKTVFVHEGIVSAEVQGDFDLYRQAQNDKAEKDL